MTLSVIFFFKNDKVDKFDEFDSVDRKLESSEYHAVKNSNLLKKRLLVVSGLLKINAKKMKTKLNSAF